MCVTNCVTKPARVTVANRGSVAAVLFAALGTFGCAESAAEEKNPAQPIETATTSTPVWMVPPTTFPVDEDGAVLPTQSTTTAAPVSTVPLAKFEDMWGFEPGDEHHDAQMCGYLYIGVPHVYALATEIGWNPDIPDFVREDDGSLESYRLILPRSGTRLDPRTRSLWVWDDGPMADGDYVCAGGSGFDYDGVAADDRPAHIPWNVTFMNQERP